MKAELEHYFRSCPSEMLFSYRKRYLGDDSKAKTAAQIVNALSEQFADRQQMRAVLKTLDGSHHMALIALSQAGGIAGGTWLLQELVLSHGGSEDRWAGVLHELGRKLLVFGNSRQAPPLFYVIPRPLMDAVGQNFQQRLSLPRASGEGVRLSKDTNFNFPVGYSLVSFLTYLEQHRVRITQKGEIFKKNLEEILDFFENLWGRTDSEKVLQWHLEMLDLLGMTRTSKGHLVPHAAAVGEWLDLGPGQRRDLFDAVFVRQAPLLMWLLRNLGGVPEGEWVPLDPLNVMFRRRYMGSVFHKRFILKTYYLPPSGFYNPNPPLEQLQIAGLVERGLGPEGSMVRISATGRAFLAGEPLGETAGDTPVPFHLQPDFEVMAPAGMPLPDLYRLGQMCKFFASDRMNHYMLTKDTVLSAMDSGWRRSEVIRFLRDNAAHGMPQNVDSTVDEWIGDHGEVEFHEALVVTVAPEKEKALRKAIDAVATRYRRMAPGVFAVARESHDALKQQLEEAGLLTVPWVREYAHGDALDETMERMMGRIAETGDGGVLSDISSAPMEFPAKQLVVLQPPNVAGDDDEEATDSMEMFTALNGDGRPIAGLGSDLGRKPGAAGSGDLLKISPAKTLDLVRAAINRQHDIEILYRHQSADGGGLTLARVTPARVHDNGGVSCFDGFDHRRETDSSFIVKRIQGIRLVR